MIPIEIMTKLQRCAVPTINAILVKSGLGTAHMPKVKAIGPARRFVGPAVTLRAVPMREDLRKRVMSGDLPDLQAAAFERVGAGEVLVIGTGGDTRASVFGDVMTTFLKVRGAAGIVIDGSVSDPEAIAGIDIPVFSGGSSALSASTFLHFTDIDVAIGCDGVAVYPGDVLVGDGNGVVVIPRAHLAEVADAAWEREEMEVFILERIANGAPLIGTYPANEATRTAYAAWRAAKGR